MVGTGTLSTAGGVTTATFATNSLAVGNHSITATYAGDGNFNTSTSSTVTEAVARPTPARHFSLPPTLRSSVNR